MNNDFRIVDPEQLENELKESKDAANIDTGDQESGDQGYELPEKFKNKSTEDIIQSYMELEKELGRKGNEIGELRKLTDTYIQQELKRTAPSEPVKEMDPEDFMEKPSTAVGEIVESHPKLKAMEDRLAQAELVNKHTQFQAKHPDYQKIVGDPDFQSWVLESNYRKNMYAKADSQFDFDAADELITAYKEHATVTKVKEERELRATKKDKALKQASTASSSTGETSPKKIYRRADLIRLRQTDPERYSALSREIEAAYAEGRVR